MMLCAKWSTLATKNIGYQEVEIAFGGSRNRWNECERFAGVA